MKPINLIIASFVILSFAGCTPKTISKVPENPCMQCYVEEKQTVKDTAVTATVVIIDGTDSFLAFLERSEKYLQEKINDWKVSHPELVNDANQQLESIHRKIVDYKKTLSEKANSLL